MTEWELTAQAVTEPPPADVPADQLRQIEMGMARDAVLAKLGIPVSRISIPDEGGMLEIYQYQAHGEPSGSIRLLNGNVTAVRAN